MLTLSEHDVRRLLRMDELLPAVRDALVALSRGAAVQPVRQVVPVAEHGGFLGAMPGYHGGALGAKLVTFYPDNRGVPTHHAVIVLFAPETGAPVAVIDGRLVTEMRTAAVSAVATDALARADARALAIVGAGVQAHSHLEALRLVRPLDDVRVWSPRGAGAFAERHGVRLAASAEDAVRGADVVLVATTAKTPVLRGAWLAPGAHVVAVGAVRPDWRELDDDVVRGRRLFVDSREAALRESGDVIASGGDPVEIGEVLAGAAPGRSAATDVTVFKSVGVAVEDLAAAALVYAKAWADVRSEY
jgi:ornithine cyclodeaminase/alanine dehydrogenase-like protein (mu-crystallin family)